MRVSVREDRWNLAAVSSDLLPASFVKPDVHRNGVSGVADITNPLQRAVDELERRSRSAGATLRSERSQTGHLVRKIKRVDRLLPEDVEACGGDSRAFIRPAQDGESQRWNVCALLDRQR